MKNVQYLSQQFNPKEYKLDLRIHRQERFFEGEVTIIGSTLPDNDTIKLHSKDLKIKQVMVDDTQTSFDINSDELTIKKPTNRPSDVVIKINYVGEINDGMHGMYPCYYEHQGQKKELVATQFESHHAREVFPCIDEPAAKAKFTVCLETELGLVVLSNTKIKHQSENGNWLKTEFQTTPIMSSYLLAWVIGELQSKSSKTKTGVEIKTWATPAQPSNNLDFGLDIAKRSIEYYEDYFKTAFPLEKCDFVALPDFSSGAMENWGLITFRESALLADPKSTSLSNKQYIALVIAHELTHHWFGNLVTMQWWDDLWLNESFASLLEYFAIDNLEPDWHIWLDFANNDSVYALRRDSLDGVQPVKCPVNHPDEIGALFDGAIVYAKGARLLNTLHSYIGDEAFRNGLKIYFDEHAYKNTVSDDLWQALEESSHKDIAKFMMPWLIQSGFPVVHLDRTKNGLKLTQQKLTFSQTDTSDCLWPVLLLSNSPKAPEILSSKTTDFKIADDEIVRFNQGFIGHFVTNYDAKTYQQIINQVKTGSLNTIDHVQLVNEQLILARAGIIKYSQLIPLLISLNKQSDPAIWDVMTLAISDLRRIVDHSPETDKLLKQLVQKIVEPIYNEKDWFSASGLTDDEIKLSSDIVSLALYAENPEARDKAQKIYVKTDINKINPNIRSSIIANFVKSQNSIKPIEDLIEKQKSSSSSDLTNDICAGICTSRQEDIIKYILDKLLNTDYVRPQDLFRWIIYLLRNPKARELTWQWIRQSWTDIKASFGGDKSYSDYPRLAANNLSTNNQLSQFSDFFDPMLSDPALKRNIEIGKKEISNNIKLIDGNLKDLQTKLNNLN